MQYGPFQWKRSKPCIFVLEQNRQIQNLQPKQRKKCEYCHFSKRNYRKKLKRIEFLLRFQRWMKKTNILRVRSVLSWTSFDAEAETGIAESQETKDDFINQQKRANCLTQTRRRLLIWTLFSATLKLMVWKMRKLKAYLRPSLTTFCRNLFERTEENRRRIRADDSFQFSAQYKLTALLRRFIRFNISKDNEFEKSWPEKSLQRSESHLFWHEHGKGNKLQAAQAIDEDEALFLNFEFGDPNPVALQRTVWWFLYNTSVSEQENYQSSDLFHRSSFCRCKLNIGSISRCTFQIFHGDVKIVQNERKRRIVIDSDGRLTLKLCLLTMSSFEFNFHSFKLRLSLDPDLIHISIKKVLFDRQKALSRILESTIAFVRFRYKVFLKFCLMNLFFELVVACSFFVWVARVIKSTSRRKASTECHIINNLLTELARAVLPRSRANIPQNGPCVRLVSG